MKLGGATVAGRSYGCWAGQAPLRVKVQGMEVRKR